MTVAADVCCRTCQSPVAWDRVTRRYVCDCCGRLLRLGDVVAAGPTDRPDPSGEATRHPMRAAVLPVLAFVAAGAVGLVASQARPPLPEVTIPAAGAPVRLVSSAGVVWISATPGRATTDAPRRLTLHATLPDETDLCLEVPAHPAPACAPLGVFREAVQP